MTERDYGPYPRCRTCCFYEPEEFPPETIRKANQNGQTIESRGLCRARPPALVVIQSSPLRLGAVFPRVSPDDWCGFHTESLDEDDEEDEEDDDLD